MRTRHSMRWVFAALLCTVTLPAAAEDAARREEPALNTYALLTLTDVEPVSLSPDGSQIAFVTRTASLESNSYERLLYVMPVSGAATPRLLGKSTPRVGVRSGLVEQRPRWIRSGEAVTLVSSFDGLDQVWEYSLRGDAPKKVSRATSNVLSHETSRDGKSVFYTTLQLGGTEEQAVSLDRSARDDGMVFEPYAFWGDYYRDRGVERYVAGHRGAIFRHWRCDLESGEIRPATEQELAMFPSGFPAVDEVDWRLTSELGVRTAQPGVVQTGIYESALSHDGKRRAYHTKSHDGQRVSILSVGDADGKNRIEWFRGTEAQLFSLQWSLDDSAVYFGQHVFDAAHGVRYQIVRVGERQKTSTVVYSTSGKITNLVFSFEHSTGRAVFLESSAVQPDQIVSLDLKSGRRRVLFDPNPQLAQNPLPQPTLLSWVNQYGVKAFAYLVRPFNYEAGKKYPLVVVTYRATGFLRGGLGDEYPVYPLAREGFAVLVVDAGEAYFAPARARDSTLYARYLSAQATLEEAIKRTERFDYVDPTRRALTGLSYGADTGWYVVTHSDLFQVAIFSDFGLDPFGRYLWGIELPVERNTLGAFRAPILTEEQRKEWEPVGISFNIPRLRAPVLINDSDSEFAAGLGITTTMTGLGKPFELIIYPHAGHIINKPAQRYSIYRRNMDWLKFWLRGEEESGSDRENQYKRWRQYRRQHEWNEQRWAQGADPGVEFAEQLRRQTRGGKVDDPADVAPTLRKEQH